MADRDGWEKEESSWGRLMAVGRDCLKDSMAGLVGSVVPIANIVAFGALIFPGDLSAGIPTVIWAMLIGGCIGGEKLAWFGHDDGRIDARSRQPSCRTSERK